MRFISRGAVIVVLMLFVPTAFSAAPREVLIGTVTRVIDGDTLDVKLSSGPIRIRLYGVDTPEKNQPHRKKASGA
jgi:endonuclease YncB( thermonuclease family)